MFGFIAWWWWTRRKREREHGRGRAECSPFALRRNGIIMSVAVGVAILAVIAAAYFT